MHHDKNGSLYWNHFTVNIIASYNYWSAPESGRILGWMTSSFSCSISPLFTSLMLSKWRLMLIQFGTKLKVTLISWFKFKVVFPVWLSTKARVPNLSYYITVKFAFPRILVWSQLQTSARIWICLDDFIFYINNHYAKFDEAGKKNYPLPAVENLIMFKYLTYNLYHICILTVLWRPHML